MTKHDLRSSKCPKPARRVPPGYCVYSQVSHRNAPVVLTDISHAVNTTRALDLINTLNTYVKAKTPQRLIEEPLPDITHRVHFVDAALLKFAVTAYQFAARCIPADGIFTPPTTPEFVGGPVSSFTAGNVPQIYVPPADINQVCESYINQLQTLAKLANTQAGQAQSDWQNAWNAMENAGNDAGNPSAMLAQANLGLNALSDMSLMSGGVMSCYDQMRALVNAGGANLNWCAANYPGITDLANQIAQDALTVINLATAVSSTGIGSALSGYQSMGQAGVAQQQQAQQSSQQQQAQAAACFTIQLQWYGVDFVFNEQCTQNLLTFLANTCDTPHALGIIGEFVSAAGGVIALAAAGAASVVLSVGASAAVGVLAAILAAECQLFQWDIQNRDKGQGITLHFSGIPFGLDGLLFATTGPLSAAAAAALWSEQGVLASGGGGGFLCELYQLMWISGN